MLSLRKWIAFSGYVYVCMFADFYVWLLLCIYGCSIYVCPSSCMSIDMFACRFVYLSISLSVSVGMWCVSVDLSLCMSLFVDLHVWLMLCMYGCTICICLSVYMSIKMYICWSVLVCLVYTLCCWTQRAGNREFGSNSHIRLYILTFLLLNGLVLNTVSERMLLGMTMHLHIQRCQYSMTLYSYLHSAAVTEIWNGRYRPHKRDVWLWTILALSFQLQHMQTYGSF